MEKNDLKKAQEVFISLCAMLDENNLPYEKNEEKLKISSQTRLEDLPIEFAIRIEPELYLITFLSWMPFDVPEDRRVELAVAVSEANNLMVNGSFDYDFLTGKIVFRMASTYHESLIGKDLFTYMLVCSLTTVDEYNDKFFFVCKNKMTLSEILNYIK